MKIKNLSPKTYHLFPKKLSAFVRKLTANSSKLKAIRGFTLVEMLVSISVFMVVMTVATGSLLSIIDANGKAQSLKSAVNNLNFAIESMGKEIRVGTNYSCLSDQPCSNGANNIKFTSYRDLNGVLDNLNDFVVYKYNSDSSGGFIERCQTSLSVTCNFDSDPIYFIRMTAKGVDIDDLKFYIRGTTDPERVLITVSGTAGTKVKLQTKFNLQTTVSQRSF